MLKQMIENYTNCKISRILNKLNIYYIHDNNDLESEFYIKNPNYGLVIRYSKKDLTKLIPQLRVFFKDSRISTTEIVKLKYLESYIRTFR